MSVHVQSPGSRGVFVTRLVVRADNMSFVNWWTSIVGVVLAVLIGQFAKHQFRTRPALAQRRYVHPTLLRSGTFALLFACLAWFGTVAAATSGDPAHRNDAVLFAGVGLSLAVCGAVLLATWWRRAGEQSRKRRASAARAD